MAICFAEGRECVKICPLFGSAIFTNSPIVKPRDNSAPVFEQSGVPHGMISAKFETLEIGIMIAFPEITNAAKDIGVDLDKSGSGFLFFLFCLYSGLSGMHSFKI